MTVVSTTKMTARQFLLLGEDPPGVRLELVEGEVAVSPSPSPEHSYTDRRLTQVLLNHIDRFQLGLLLGDTDTILGQHDIRRPDLIFFTRERQHLVQRSRPIDGAPDLCVEIVSPSSGTVDRKDKFAQYAAGGVRHYWIIDPQTRSAEAFELLDGRYVRVAGGQGDDVVSFPPFAQLQIPLAEIWFPVAK